MLTPQLEQLWNDYRAVELRGTRDAKIKALNSFIARITQSPMQEWDAWACDLAERVVDYNEDLPLRIPLFQHVIFPALLNGHRNQILGCARWLAGLSQHLYQCPDCQRQLPESEQTEVGLLRAAIRYASTDQRSRQQLIDALANQLRYALHELPAGVLYGMNGATAEQCLELQSELQEFITLLKQSNQLEQFQELVDHCQFHFIEYRTYLLRCKEFESYADYLRHVANTQPT